MAAYKFVYQSWWKWLCVALLFYVFIAGFLVPLRPGIIDVDAYKLVAGEDYQIGVTTYNAHLDKTDRNITAYLKINNDHFLPVENVTMTGRNHLSLQGLLPSEIPGSQTHADATLIIHDNVDGYLLLPAAFLLTQQEATQSMVADDDKWLSNIGTYDQEWSFRFPFISLLYETIRNTFFHVAIWMAMFILLVVSLIYSIRYMISKDLTHDSVAASFTHVAILLGVMGLATGSIWGKATWGAYWPDDPKTNMSAISVMIYMAYGILRASIPTADRRAQLSAAYNVFSFAAMVPLIFIIPRLLDGLHPGNGGNPALGGEDLDSTLRLIFYPAIIAYTLLGVWLASMLFRLRNIQLAVIRKQLDV